MAAGTNARVSVTLLWALAGGSCGLGVGFTLDSMGSSGATVAGVLGGVALGGLGATLALGLARARRGTLPLWVRAVPLTLLVGALLWLVVIGAIRADSPVPAVVYSLLAIGAATRFVPLWAQDQLARALVLLEEGDLAEAESRLRLLQRRGRLTPVVRQFAWHYLGLIALYQGRLTAASGWLEGVTHARVVTRSRVTLAWVWVLQERYEEAEQLVRSALSQRASAGVAAQLDAVRVLLVWRQEGPEPAVALGKRLSGPGSGALLRGLLAALGEESGPQLREQLATSPLAATIPEIIQWIDGTTE